MKTAGKKIASIVLALALCMSLTCTAFAASGNTGSIIINGTSGETYNIYQIFDLTYTSDDSGAPSNDASYSYKVVDAWAAFFAAGAAGAEYVTLDANGYVTSFSLTDDNAAEFARAALAWAENNNIQATRSLTLGQGQSSATYSGLALGYYLVGSSLGTVCMLDNTDPDAVITEKNKTPTVAIYVWDTDKQTQTDEGTSDDAAVVDSLMYEIVISQAAGSSSLVLHNTANKDLNYDTDNITVSVKTDTGTTVVDSSNYTITVDPDDECTIHITFTDEFLATLGDSDQISIMVPATITGNSEDFDADEAKYDNTVWVSYGDAGVSEKAEADVYSYGFEINKYTGSSEGTAVPSEEGTWGIYAYLEPGTYYILSVITVSGGYSAASYVHDQADEGSEFEKSEEVSNLYELGTLGVNSRLEAASYVTITEAGTYYFTHEERGTTTYADSSPWYFVPSTVAPSIASESTATAAGVVLAQDGYFTVSEGSEQALAGAQFVLQNSSGLYAVFGENGVLTGWSETQTSDCVLYSTADGYIAIEGLDQGTYTLTEIAAPDGYNKLEDPLTINIEPATDENGNIDYSEFVVTIGNGESAVVATDNVVDVENHAGSELPSTGGIGTTIFYIIGGVLVAGAVVVLITRRRMSSGD